MVVNHRRSASRPLGLAALLAALAAPIGVASLSTAASADYRDDYKAGVEAVEAKKWSDAIRLLRAAIAEKGEEKSGFRDYFPHYYLGVALSESGDCRAALEALKSSESQGQVQKRAPLATDLAGRRKRCLDRVSAADQAAMTARDAIESARGRFASLDGIAAVPEMRSVWTEGGADSFQSRRLALERQLKTADAGLEEAHRTLDVARLDASREAAGRVEREVETLATAARGRLEALGKATAAAVEKLEDLEASLRKMLRSIDDLQPYPPELAKRVAESEAALEAAGSLSPSAGPAAIQKVEDDLTVAMSRLRRAAQRPPQALLDAVDAYLRGDYASAIAALEGRSFDDPRAAGQACLVRAASRHATWALGGERDGEALAAVTAEIVACGRLKPVPEPDGVYFSPRFRDLYRTSLAGGAAP